MKIPVAKPFIGKEEADLVREVVYKGEISGTFGEYISKFEEGFAKYSNCSYGVSTTNGTAALHLALAALNIGKGDEVLVSTLTNMATFFAVIYQGAKPVPVDVEPETWNLDPSLLEGKINENTKAILVVHLFGHPVDMDPILEIADKYDLYVVEDATEAHGAEYKGRKVGSLGNVGCFSFYANKIITTGEGGMLTTNSKEIAERAKKLSSLAYGKENKFMHSEIGFNYKMTNMQAAVGYAQLKRIDKVIDLKRKIADFYKKNLAGIEELQLPPGKDYAKSVYWMFHIVLRGGLKGKRAEFTKRLEEAGIETRPSFIPFNMQEVFIEKGLTSENECPNANYVAENGLYIPSGPDIKEEELRQVVEEIKKTISDVKG